MPMVEVLYVRNEPLNVERKRAFVKEMEEIFQEELGTPPERLRLVFQHIEPEDSKIGLEDKAGAENKEDRSPAVGGGHV
jgi:phenylpyruvate tautomerase PptA (4-oxalocrotonate tautomerase family)